MPHAIAVTLIGIFLAATTDDPPVFGRPSAHYYDAVGERIRVEMSAAPTEIRVEQELTLTVRVSGARNPAEIRRPDLNTLEDFATRFFVDDLDDGPAPATSDRVFHYKLRPKNDAVKEIPPLLFRYWQPRLQYFAATSPENAVPLTVRTRETSEATAVPIQAPEFLFQIAEGDAAFEQPARPLPAWSPFVALFAPALACLVWYAVWWRANPGAAQLAHFRRVRAVRGALDGLQRLHRESGAGAAGQVAAIVRGYLRERWAMAAGATTPTEIATGLRAALPPAHVEQVAALFRACDAAHFGPSPNNTSSLAVEAEKLIQTLELYAGGGETGRPRSSSTVAAIGLLLALFTPVAAVLARELDDGRVELATAGAAAFREGVAARGDDQRARAHFAKAAEQYAAVRTNHGPLLPQLLHNEGNARVLAGDVGGAMAVYRLGLRTAPQDDGLRRGLEYARSQVQFASPGDRIRLTPHGEAFPGATHFLGDWIIAAVAALAAVGWGTLTRWLMVRSRPYRVIGLAALGLAIALAGTRLVAEHHQASEARAALAVTAKPAVLRLGDGPSFLPRLDAPLPAGVEAKVVDDRGAWLHVELADGTLGWLPRDAVALIE